MRIYAGLHDRYARRHDDLRVSVTDRCNLRCRYCKPNDTVWFPRDRILKYEEIHRVAAILARIGLRKIRLTGGEPLARRNLAGLVRMLSTLPGIEDLAVTTNGVLLTDLAGELAGAGLKRVNVSLETLSPARFRKLTGKDSLSNVLQGIEAAQVAGLEPVKINTVLIRGFNDDEAVPLAGFARQKNWEIRFIEYMPLGNGDDWSPEQVVTGKEVLDRIQSNWEVEPAGSDKRGTARRFLYKDGRGCVGFINPVSEPFCNLCSRLRLTADGKLKTCLHDGTELDLVGKLRAGGSDEEVAALVYSAVQRKLRAPVSLGHACSRTMHQIGG